MKVYVLWGEHCFSHDGEVAWVEGVYSTHERAKAAKREAEHSYIANNEGATIYGAEPPEEGDDSDWDASFNIEEHELDLDGNAAREPVYEDLDGCTHKACKYLQSSSQVECDCGHAREAHKRHGRHACPNCVCIAFSPAPPPGGCRCGAAVGRHRRGRGCL